MVVSKVLRSRERSIEQTGHTAAKHLESFIHSRPPLVSRPKALDLLLHLRILTFLRIGDYWEFSVKN